MTPPDETERAIVARYVDAHERGDVAALMELFGDEVRFSMPPEPPLLGRGAAATLFDELFGPDGPGAWRLVATEANGHPAAANYIRAPGEHELRAVTFDVLTIEDGVIVEVVTFDADCFTAFGLPAVLDET